jgi:hypothetical protein
MKIRCECAFTYMNAVFRKNLTQAMAVDANSEDAALDTEARSAVSPASRCLAGQS